MSKTFIPNETYTREMTLDIWPFDKPRNASTQTTYIDVLSGNKCWLEAMVDELHDYQTNERPLENVTRIASSITANEARIDIWQQIVTKPATGKNSAEGFMQYTTIKFRAGDGR